MAFRRTLVGGAATGTLFLGVYFFDKYFYYSTLGRSVNTIRDSVIVALDYKLNFEADKSDGISSLHARTAQRIYNLCRGNGGLYIKFGQQIAEYNLLFKQLYDKAPSHPIEVVRDIVMEEFGRPIEEVFQSFSSEPMASASIAQVHKATLKDGTVVAVKVQKPEIKTQIGWDLFCYSLIMRGLEIFFELPVASSAEYVTSHIHQETDFINEAHNGEKCQEFIKNVPSLNATCHVPKIYWDLTTKRILTAEWIDGIALSDTTAIQKTFNAAHVMTLIQIFRTGFVHCDPHPGNIIVRSHPFTKIPQIVLLDHGLYVKCDPRFTQQYCRFWKSLFIMDMVELDKISSAWGLPDVSLFATATLARPWKKMSRPYLEKASMSDAFAMHTKAKGRLVEFLKNSDKIPKELIFIGRNLNCIRGINKELGSVVNRINIMAKWAAWAAKDDESGANTDGLISSLILAVKRQLNLVIFQSLLFVGTLGFYYARTIQRVKGWFGLSDPGFEGFMDARMKAEIEQKMPGIVIDESIFNS